MNPSLDCFSRAFLEYENLPFIERLGKAVKELAKYDTAITFGSCLLPTYLEFKGDITGAWHTNTNGLAVWYDYNRLKYENEEELEYLKSNEEKMKLWSVRQYVDGAYSQAQKELTAAKAIWGGGWGGHSNPDYGLLLRIGTEGMR